MDPRRRGANRGREPGDGRDDRDASPSSAPTRSARSSPLRGRRSPGGRSWVSRGAPRSCSRPAAGWSPTPSAWSRRSAARRGGPADETQLAELSYGLSALEFWARMAPALPRRRGDRVGVAARRRPQDLGPLRAGRRGRRDRPVELPAQQLVRRLHPGARRRQLRGHEAVGGDPADLAADGRDAGRVRDPRRRLQRRHRPRRDRRGADRRGRLRDVHRLGRDRARR